MCFRILNKRPCSSIPFPLQHIIQSFYIQFGPWKEERAQRERERRRKEQNAKLEIGLRTSGLWWRCMALVLPQLVVHQVNEAGQKLIRSINPFRRFSSLNARHAQLTSPEGKEDLLHKWRQWKSRRMPDPKFPNAMAMATFVYLFLPLTPSIT